MNIKIKIAGLGGQGIQFIGKLLGEAAFKQGINVSEGVVYEPSTKGGLTVADITLSPLSKEIYYPFIEHPDILVLFSQRAWGEFKHLIQSYTIVLADQDNVKEFSSQEVERAKIIFHLPFSRKAIDIGSEDVTNVVILGFLSEMLDISDNYVPALLNEIKSNEAEELELLEVDPEHFEESLIKYSPKKFREMNKIAFRTGYNMSLNAEYSKKGISEGHEDFN